VSGLKDVLYKLNVHEVQTLVLSRNLTREGGLSEMPFPLRRRSPLPEL